MKKRNHFARLEYEDVDKRIDDFLDSLSNMTLNLITVVEISRKTGISGSTLYRHRIREKIDNRINSFNQGGYKNEEI